jgi:hypothetical protein
MLYNTNVPVALAGQAPFQKIPNPLFADSPKQPASFHFQFFRSRPTNIYGPATLAGQGSCLLYLSNPAKSPKQPAFYLQGSITYLKNVPLKKKSTRIMIPKGIHQMALIP